MQPDLTARARSAVTVGEEALVRCETRQGNGEVVTDWERYLHPRKGDVGGEAVAECPDCAGTGGEVGEKANGPA